MSVISLKNGSFFMTVAAAALFTGTSAYAQLDPDAIRQQYRGTKLTPQQTREVRPTTPNPWLSLRPDTAGVDWNYWNARKHQASRDRAAQLRTPNRRVQRKSGDGTTFLPRFGTGAGQNGTVQIAGEFQLPEPSLLTANPEDEGAIPLATETGLIAGNAVQVSGTIGDGDFGLAGTGSGDFDFYAIRFVKAGDTIVVDVDTALPFAPLDPFVAVYTADGTIIAANDDFGGSFDSFVSVEAPEDGDYYVSIGTFGNPILVDPFDSSTGTGVEDGFFPVPNEGDYTVTMSLNYADEQWITFVLEKGDVVGASLTGTPGSLSLNNWTGEERSGSETDLSFITPDVSPLPSGDASVSHVVDVPGTHTLKVRGMMSGPFTLDLVAALPALRTGGEDEFQTIFLDFDGATVDLQESIAQDSPNPIIVTLSPLADFLGDWGLTAADEDAVIDAIVARVEESLVSDIASLGKNPDFKIRVLNSRDHADPWGQPNVSRVIVGGTIAELGVGTIGIAQSIDVGNFDTEETAFVLLDILSGQLPSTIDLNGFPLDPSASIIDIIAVGVGEITAHEAGHYLGCWHTDQFNEVPNIMDQGGNLEFSILGLGPDGIFGSADDTNVQFVRDEFNPNEGFTGIEDTRNTIGYGSTQSP